MARRRMIDPEFFLDEELALLSPHARLLYIGSWTLADDRAFTFPYRPEWLKAQLFPYEQIKMEKLIAELTEKGKFIVFKAEDEKQYIYIKNMDKYQHIEKPSKQRYPAYSGNGSVELPDYSGNTHSKVKLSKVNIYTDQKETFFDVVRLTDKEFLELKNRFGEPGAQEKIKSLALYIQSKGDKYKSHYHTILMWEHKNKKEEVKCVKMPTL